MGTGIASLVGTMGTRSLDTEVPTVECHQRKLYDSDKAQIEPRTAVWYHTMQSADERLETVEQYRKSWAVENLLNVKP